MNRSLQIKRPEPLRLYDLQQSGRYVDFIFFAGLLGIYTVLRIEMGGGYVESTADR